METFRTEECTWCAAHLRFFHALVNGELSRVDTAKLERAILAVAKQLVEQLTRSRHWWLDKIGISSGGLAGDAVAELLVKDAKGPCAGLRKSLERMSPFREDAASHCHCVHGILNNLVHQALSRLLAQHDPAHAHMQRALRRHERNTHELTLLPVCAGHVYHIASTDILHKRPYMPLEELTARITLPAKTHRRGGLLQIRR